MRLLSHPLVRWLFLAASVAAGAVALWSYWPEVTAALGALPPRSIAIASAATIAYVAATMLCWRSIVQGLGAALPLRQGAQLFFVSQIGKYIPGGIWNVVAITEMGQEYSVPRRTGVAGMLVFWLVSVTTGLFAGGLYVGATQRSVPGGAFWIGVTLTTGLIILSPPVLRRALRFGLRVLRRPPLVLEPSAAGLLRAIMWAFLGWFAAGLQVWIIAESMSLTKLSLVSAVSAYALAWTAGFLVVAAPAGAGVREVVLGALFAGVLNAGSIVTLVLLSRFLITGADFLLAGASLLVRRLSAQPRTNPIP